jgi:hypothetical protein
VNADVRFPVHETSFNVYQTNNLFNSATPNAYSTSTPELNKINAAFHQESIS